MPEKLRSACRSVVPPRREDGSARRVRREHAAIPGQRVCLQLPGEAEQRLQRAEQFRARWIDEKRVSRSGVRADSLDRDHRREPDGVEERELLPRVTRHARRIAALVQCGVSARTARALLPRCGVRGEQGTRRPDTIQRERGDRRRPAGQRRPSAVSAVWQIGGCDDLDRDEDPVQLTADEARSPVFRRRAGDSSYTLGRGWSYVNGDSNTTIATPADIQRSWARTDQDRLHSWVESFLCQLPVGPGHKWLNDGPLSQVLGGWQLSGIFSAQSGSPIGITMSAATLNAPGNTQRPDVSGTPKVLGGIGSGVLWFDTSGFSSPAANTFGNSPRNGVLDGPKYVNLDATIAKLLSFSRIKGEVRVDIFNITNTPHFNNPNGTFLGATFGQITSTVANSERSMRFGFRLMF